MKYQIVLKKWRSQKGALGTEKVVVKMMLRATSSDYKYSIRQQPPCIKLWYLKANCNATHVWEAFSLVLWERISNSLSPVPTAILYWIQSNVFESQPQHLATKSFSYHCQLVSKVKAYWSPILYKLDSCCLPDVSKPMKINLRCYTCFPWHELVWWSIDILLVLVVNGTMCLFGNQYVPLQCQGSRTEDKIILRDCWRFVSLHA